MKTQNEINTEKHEAAFTTVCQENPDLSLESWEDGIYVIDDEMDDDEKEELAAKLTKRYFQLFNA